MSIFNENEERINLQSQPKYRLIQQQIRAWVDNGKLPRGSKLPAEQELAREFGVAYMTMRAALNGLAAEGLVIRVHGKGTFVADEPQSLQKGHLGFLLSSVGDMDRISGDNFMTEISRGFHDSAVSRGYGATVMVGSKSFIEMNEETGIGFNGIAVLVVKAEDEKNIEAMIRLGVPVLAVNHYTGKHAISTVSIDQAQGISQAVNYVCGLGHTRIAFLKAGANNLTSDERTNAFLRSLAQHGLKPTGPLDLEPADYWDISGYERTKILLNQPVRPTAILTVGDYLAAGAYRAIREAGLSIPKDISVVGYSDFPIASHLDPTLTTIKSPIEKMGTSAASLLADQLSGKAERKNIVLAPELIIRNSVA